MTVRRVFFCSWGVLLVTPFSLALTEYRDASPSTGIVVGMVASVVSLVSAVKWSRS